MNQKLICYKCDAKIDIENELPPLAKIDCSQCQATITIPYVIGDLILDKEISDNKYFKTYKAYRQSSERNLCVRIIESKSMTAKETKKAVEQISLLNANDGNELLISEIDDKIILIRPYYTQSLKNYLSTKRPTSESAYSTILSLAQQLKKAADQKLLWKDLSISKLFVNEQGELILTDHGLECCLDSPKSGYSADSQQAIVAFKTTIASIVYDSKQKASLLAFRDKPPRDLQICLNKLLQSDDTFEDFTDIHQSLSKVNMTEVNKGSVANKAKKKKSASVNQLKKAPKKNRKLKSKNILKKSRPKKSMTPLLLVAALVFIVLSGTVIFKLTQKPEVVAKAPEKKVFKPRKKVAKDKPKAPARVIAVQEMKPLPVFELKADMEGHISLLSFSEIMNRNCTSCHGAEGKEIEGKFNMVKLMASKGIHPRHWQAVYKQIEQGDMPPEDEKPLTDDEKIFVLKKLRQMISQTAVNRKTRALTPDEIKNTLVDIFKIDNESYNPFTPLYANYAQDDFYTTQKSVITPYYIDDLYETLHDALESYVSLKPQTEPLNLEATFPGRIPIQQRVGSKSELRWSANERNVVQVNFKDLGPKEPQKRVLRRDIVGPDSAIDAQLAKLTLPPGTYKLSFDAQAVNLHRGIDEKKYGPQVAAIFKRLQEKQDYSLPVSFFVVPPGQADPHARIKSISTVDISSSEMSRYTVEFTLNRRNGLGYRFPTKLMPGAGQLANLIANHRIKGRAVELKDIEAMYKQFIYSPNYDFAMVRFQNVAVEGPFDVEVSPYSLEDSERFNNITIRKKFRTLHNENMIQMNMSYDYIFDKFRQRKIEREESYRNSLVAFFLSTEFLILDYDTKDRRKHARMLSYVFHKSLPSKELNEQFQIALKAKDKGDFADWLIDHPYFNRYVESFTKQWLHLSKVNEAMPDQKKFRRFYNDKLMESYTQEAAQFILHLLRENRPIKELIAADYSVIDNKLISFYEGGRQREKGGFQKYTFRNKNRGGLLATGAFLTATGNGVEQLPIKRAEWILKNLLDSELPPPPDDIDLEQFQQDLSAPLHQRLAAHSKDPKCYSCHQKIDPLAIMMNGFNTIGDNDHSKGSRTVKLNGTTLRNFPEFKEYLGSQEEALARSFTKSLLKYSLGRDLYYQDTELINKIIEENRQQNFPAKDLMKSIIKHYFF